MTGKVQPLLQHSGRSTLVSGPGHRLSDRCVIGRLGPMLAVQFICKLNCAGEHAIAALQSR